MLSGIFILVLIFFSTFCFTDCIQHTFLFSFLSCVKAIRDLDLHPDFLSNLHLLHLHLHLDLLLIFIFSSISAFLHFLHLLSNSIFTFILTPGAGPDLSDWLCLGAGYASLACFALLAAWLMVSWRVLLLRWRPHFGRHSLSHTVYTFVRELGPRLMASAGQSLESRSPRLPKVVNQHVLCYIPFAFCAIAVKCAQSSSTQL